MPTLRPGTVDASLWNGMGSEYPLVPQMQNSDVVLDLGAHIGSFAKFACERGAGEIHSFEADRENYEICVHNLRKYRLDGNKVIHFYCYNKAVWRSDVPEDEVIVFDGYRKIGATVNTGGGSVSSVKLTTDEIVIRDDNPNPNAISRPVLKTISLDDILSTTPTIRLMKIDIEGAEWEVLFTSRLLSASTVQTIVGEYHIDDESKHNLQQLRELFFRKGYRGMNFGDYNRAHYQMCGQKIGPFWAER